MHSQQGAEPFERAIGKKKYVEESFSALRGQSHPFEWDFPLQTLINHPFWGYPHFRKPPHRCGKRPPFN